MTEQLRRAVAQIEQFPEAAQNIVAAKLMEIAQALSEERWENLLSDPRSDIFFEQMAQAVEAAKQSGTLRPIYPILERDTLS